VTRHTPVAGRAPAAKRVDASSGSVQKLAKAALSNLLAVTSTPGRRGGAIPLCGSMAPPGIAFSGGGIIALLASMCQLQALEERFPNITSGNALLAATSGGIAGAVLHASAAERLGFPPSWAPEDYGSDAHTVLSTRFEQPGVHDSAWFGAIVDLLDLAPNFTEVARSSSRRRRSSSSSAEAGAWWEAVLAVATRHYKLDPAALTTPPGLVTTTSLLRSAAAPIDRAPSGVLLNASGNFFPAEFLPAAGTLRVVGATARQGPPALSPVGVLQGTAYATSFWAAQLLESSAAFMLAQGLLPQTDGFFLLDGGTHDSTALIALARRRSPRALSFFNDDFSLGEVSAPYGYLFGVPSTTSDMSTWQGPALAQIFPSSLWPTVLRNLTDPEVGAALLFDVPVLSNPYLGVEGGYTMEALLILTTQPSEPFLSAFDAVDVDVRANLHGGWPEAMPLADMSPLDANALCVLAGWGVATHEQTIREFVLK